MFVLKNFVGCFFFVGCSLRKEIAEDYRAGCSPHNPVPPTFLIAHKIGILYIWAVLPFQRNFALFLFDHLIFKIYNMNFGLQKMKAWIFNHVFLLAFFLGRFWSDGVSQSSPPTPLSQTGRFNPIYVPTATRRRILGAHAVLLNWPSPCWVVNVVFQGVASSIILEFGCLWPQFYVFWGHLTCRGSFVVVLESARKDVD